MCVINPHEIHVCHQWQVGALPTAALALALAYWMLCTLVHYMDQKR